jgi:hypothetical protein
MISFLVFFLFLQENGEATNNINNKTKRKTWQQLQQKDNEIRRGKQYIYIHKRNEKGRRRKKKNIFFFFLRINKEDEEKYFNIYLSLCYASAV